MRILRYFGSLALLLVLGCFSGQVLAQNKGYEPTFLSPNASSLLSYNQSIINGYTGQINLSVPIWHIESKGLSLKLSLGYNSGGNKVEDIASWVGLGWSLSGLPMISRQVRGLPDEEPRGYIEGYQGGTMQYYVNNFEGSAIYTNFKTSTAAYPIDTEADVFYLSINNFSGRFFYDQMSNRFLTEEVTDIKIVYDRNTNSFTVTDDSGIIYTFSVGETSQLDGTGPGKPTLNSWLPSKIENSTKTSSIQIDYTLENQLSYRIGPNVKYIQFGPNYNSNLSDNFSFLTSTVKSFIPSVITFDGGKIKFIKNISEREDLAGAFSLNKVVISDTKDNIISQTDFKYSYRTGTGITIYRSNKWMFLDSVALSGSNGAFNHKYCFSYDVGPMPPSRISYAQDWWGYYNGAVTNTNLIGPSIVTVPGQINKLHIGGADRLVNEQYSQFGILKKVQYPTGGSSEYTYENNETADMKVPSSYDKHQLFLSAEEMWQDPEPVFPNQKSFVDHFTINNSYDPFLNNNQNGGVFLSADVTDLGVPAGTTGASIRIRGLSASNSNVSHLFYESFKNIYFPNGDYEIKAEFNQNPPNYMNFVCGLSWYTKKSLTTNKLGGLRIRETKDYSASGTIAFSKKYFYSYDRFGQKSSGKLFSGSDFNNVIDHVSRTQNNKQGINNYVEISASPSTQLISQNSSIVGYDRVYEVMTSHNDTTLVKYDYINIPDENSFTHPYPPAQSFAVQNGKVQQETVFLLKNNKLDSLQKTSNDYDLSPGDQVFYNLKRVDDDGIYGGALSASIEYPGYYPYTFTRLKCNLLNTVKTTYSPIGNTQSSTTNFYNALGDLIQSDQSLSTGRTTRYKYIYPADAVFTGANENARLWMISNNVVSKPVRTKKYEVNGSSEKLLEEHISYHKQYGTLSQNVFIEKAEILKPAEVSERITFPSYDKYGNLQEIKKQENPTVTYLWGYGGQYPIAEIRNATYAEVALVLTQAAIDNLNSSQTETSMETLIRAASDKLRSDSRLAKAMVTTYTYKPLVGMTSKMDARGITEYYNYDGMQRLQAIFDHLNNVNRSFDYHYRSN
ncbi:hypothetical protein BCY89_21825 [Sphingobacterium siyangense]|uniref:YD repeat-containing protein n=1 Tax=Sphingobacterium siyangense TaxID=459529 RepID=A0A420G788_9SPHI|nr:hypothetical protein [Sphingobacterium siyangense]RKF41059.1 hypothetical protein BCY89_21825 [Sphingobacterium siyangense]